MNLEPRTEAETREEYFFLACSPLFVQSVFYINQAYLPRDGTAHSGLSSSTSIVNQEEAPQMCLYANQIQEGFSQLRFPLPG